MNQTDAIEFLRNRFYFDIHGHNAGLTPFLWRLASRFTIPRDVTPKQIVGMGANGGMLCALGDPATFKKGIADSYALVRRQLKEIRTAVGKAGAVIALTSTDLKAAAAANDPVFMLGIEGGDFIEEEPNRLDEVYDMGVRLLILVHYSKNQLGSLSLRWGGKWVPQEEQTGLTPLGEQVVKRAVELGMIIDLAHADEKTVSDVTAITAALGAPVIASHTGARALQDFPRYISDEAIGKISAGGGLIGLWPFLNKGAGMSIPEDFKNHARHIRDLCGIGALAIGTDFNGVPGYMKEYPDMLSAASLIRFLSEAGFRNEEIEAVAGGNFLRLMEEVENASPRRQ